MKQKQSDLIELLSVNNIVPLLSIVVAITIFLIQMQSGNALLEYKIDQLSIKLDKYVLSRETAASKMADQTEMRNSQISKLQQDMGVVKNLLKLP